MFKRVLFVMFLVVISQLFTVTLLGSQIVSATTEFGFRVLKELTRREGERNICFSPQSLATALTICYNGADGNTKEAMAKTLALEGLSLSRINEEYSKLAISQMDFDQDVRLNLANSLWAEKDVPFRKKFFAVNQEFYKAKIQNLNLHDPKSLELINAWFREKTKGKITEMVDSSDLGAILFILNAVYFQGTWSVGFSREYTLDNDFTLLDGRAIKVSMMSSQSDSYSYYKGSEFEAVELPYGKGRLGLYLFLPDKESSLKKFQENLNRMNWESWMAGFSREMVMVFLPRLKLEYEILLNDVLEAMGMDIAFTGQANFSKMCSGGAFIDKVMQKTSLDINEEGTEATAATMVKMKRGGRHVVQFDRPFFYVIRDNLTGSILFMGSVVEPTLSAKELAEEKRFPVDLLREDF